ncbi:pyridoxamine 5'-phosphate oxidase family protein [Prauserella muralis]|uniref:Pyridoxamine 5'-phosphate oxidase n=1 Tax=Prauserella muralis TaxID=588067 RepID=A0A2V4B8A4_9PSEU|nr:pyridoxamine 5'-phosphate oxidase family protein [Prauserella muralis]PXY31488.1 pyridoxamine 5'-phosphate oxidase [Prauserella muralis]TWE14165.1 PPOX class probable F420-dependent enzyme [Prauserella muralis]
MSRRGQIRMSPDEVVTYLERQRVINVATIGPHGRPHLAPLWYVPRGAGMATWTYRKAQKVANLRRLPEATVLVESGDSYETLRGVSMECDVELVEDTGAVADIGLALALRYAGTTEVTDELRAFVGGQAPKRIGLVFTPTKVVSWDHTKLGGTY